MVAILLEANYINSTGCKLRYGSLTDTLRKKRIPFCEIFDTCPKDVDTVFIISADTEWTAHTIKQLNSNGFVPILICDIFDTIPGCIYNAVCSDLNVSMKNLLEFLKLSGKTNPALYAFNPNSIADISKANILTTWAKNCFESIDIYKNNGSLEECFETFENSDKKYDSVVCANDFAAISLVKLLKKSNPEKLKRLSVISCTSSSLSELYKDDIQTINLNHDQYGRAAVYIYEALKKHDYLSSMTIKIVWDFDIPDGSKKTKDISFDYIHSTDSFYEDTVVKELLIADEYLNISDNTDRMIIDMLLKSKPIDLIADATFLCENAVKYRIKRLVTNSGAQNKSELLKIIDKYTIRR